MRRPTWFLLITLIATAGNAAKVNMNDPRRAVGAEDDVRVDAQLTNEVVSTGAPLGVTFQIYNLSPRTVAVADKVCEASYDGESRTITLSVGSEVPKGGELPRLVTIPPGEKRTFTTGANVNLRPTLAKQRMTTPAFVQIKVNVLRDVTPFAALMERASRASTTTVLSDAEFDEWLSANASIELNVIPVRYHVAEQSRANDASQH
jgi:hypothetical protein